ncbi:nucleotide disphospho-sugar-binding domain-containing protein [Kitasatospora sp. NPDC052896]|uniref:nucleotide disphospho-sugar-binding domain-containing protein n=1 Tax=Kitasatospora sp. NPDC052896 TaxID=3364061 RepID=UPI0037C7885D
MRVLLITTPVSTHLTPLVPLAWALRAAGHELIVAGRSDVMTAASSAGLNAVELGGPMNIDELLAKRLAPGRRPLESWGRPELEQLSNIGRLWMPQTLEALPRYLELARRFGPDLIIGDTLEYLSLLLGEELAVPVVHHRWGVDPVSGQARAAGRDGLREAYERLGLTDLPDPTLLLDPCPPGLQLPGIAPGAPIRHVPFNGNGTLPGWLNADRGGATESARVAVTLGGRTIEYNGAGLFRHLIEAFDRMPDVEAVVTVQQKHHAALGPLPANVRLVEPVPLNLLLDSCSAVIHHGGAGTAMTTTSFGLPQLVLPQLADQFWFGERVAEVGAGLALDDPAEQDDPARVREAVRELLAEPHYGKAAGELRAEMAAMPSPARVVRDLEELTR